MESPCDKSTSNTPTPLGSSQGEKDSNQPPPSNSAVEGETNTGDTFNDGAKSGVKRKRSVVWNHFKQMKVSGEDKAECNYCQKKLGGNSKNGTKHLLDHFERCPRRTVRDIRHINAYIFNRFIYVPAPHTAEALAGLLYDCLCDWNLDRKLSTLTVDNCTTNDAIISKLLDKLPLRSLMMKGQLFHMRCCAHILNLIVQDGLSVIEEGIERIRDSVLFWSASGKREERFEEAAHQLEIDYTKKLTIDCKTRWNSTYTMLSVAIPYKDVFTRLKLRESRYTCVPTDLDWQLAKEICDRLQLFYKVTLLFSGNKYPTANVFYPLICEISFSLREWTKCSIDEISLMAYKMISKFDKYWSVIHGIMGMAAVLDPRYKLKFVEKLMPALYGDEKAKEEFKTLEAFVRNFFKEYESTNSSARNNYEGSGSGSSSVSSGLPINGGFQKFWSDITSIDSDDDEPGDMAELDHYLKEKTLPKDVDLDLLLWWKANGGKYPTLQRMAKDILAIPVSTVASESAFSTSGRLISPHRSRLHPKTLEALMCAQSWLLNEIRATCSEETEAYCRSIEYDYDVEEGSTKESDTTILD